MSNKEKSPIDVKAESKSVDQKKDASKKAPKKAPKKAAKKDTKVVRILLPVAGKYLMSANVGDEVELPIGQATQLVEDKHAEEVK